MRVRIRRNRRRFVDAGSEVSSVRDSPYLIAAPRRQTRGPRQLNFAMIRAPDAAKPRREAMTAIHVRQDGDLTTVHLTRRGGIARQVLLACGVLSSLVYLA